MRPPDSGPATSQAAAQLHSWLGTGPASWHCWHLEPADTCGDSSVLLGASLPASAMWCPRCSLHRCHHENRSRSCQGPGARGQSVTGGGLEGPELRRPGVWGADSAQPINKDPVIGADGSASAGHTRGGACGGRPQTSVPANVAPGRRRKETGRKGAVLKASHRLGDLAWGWVGPQQDDSGPGHWAGGSAASWRGCRDSGSWARGWSLRARAPTSPLQHQLHSSEELAP